MNRDDIHTCHSECQRPICVAVREAVAAEREACAKVLDEMAAADKLSNYYRVAALVIRERGAQPEPEPVAWMYVNADGECEQIEYGEVLDDPSVTPLYTAPPQREWQGLTDEEVGMLTVFDGLHHVEVPLLADFIRAIEAKLKEKNT
jgi:hypothetical protein